MGSIVAIGLYLVVVALAYSFQRNLLYFPDQQSMTDAPAGFSYVEPMNARDGSPYRSLFKQPSDDSQPIILHLHGNGGSITGRIPMYHAMTSEGAGLLAVGYPGYGGNPQKPSEQSMYDVAQNNFSHLLELGFAPERIVIVGQSLGTGIATKLAIDNAAAGLILEAAYTGMDDMAQQQFPYLPARWLVKDRYRSRDRIADIDMPLSWIHGTADELIPFAMGQRLFDAASEPKTAHPIAGGGHNDLWAHGIAEIVRADALRFVRGQGVR
jgi:fermentation-respiration switch protein FrsA (DUF1100 family)